MDTKKIIKDITSRDVKRIRTSSSKIIYAGQDEDKIAPLIPFLLLIKLKTRNLNLGGALAPNSRFPKYAIKTIEFHRNQKLGSWLFGKKCTCLLYTGAYDGFNPRREVENGNVLINSEIEGHWAFDFIVQCQKCKTEYNVIQRYGHYTWWKWTKRK